MNTAEIYSYSIVYASSVEFKDKTPYVCAIIENDEGRLSCLLEGYEPGMNIQIGRQVKRIGGNSGGEPVYSL